MLQKTSRVLPVIVMAQFACTSLWFAGNAVIPDLVKAFQLPPGALGHITSAVQLGFIAGTFCFALFTISDHFAPSRVFFFSAVAAACSNLAIACDGQSLISLMLLRFITGFFLAGIYPVGMKIAADHFEKGLGKALGFLVGALVVGTAFPHLLKGITGSLPWKSVLIFTSGLSLTGGFLMLLIPNGPYRGAGSGMDLSALVTVFKNKDFRSASFGYFGHMWELYAFWAFVPLMLTTYNQLHAGVAIPVPAISFLVIGLGGLACIGAGYISQKYGPKRTAFTALSLSCLCCLASPLAFYMSGGPFLIFLIFWGMVVVADSPMLSTLVAFHAPQTLKGTALTIVICIGFSITIGSIELINSLINILDSRYLYTFLGAGPMLGLFFMMRSKAKRKPRQSPV